MKRVTTPSPMRCLAAACAATLLLFITVPVAQAGLGDLYRFEAGTGTKYNMSGATTLYGWGYIYHYYPTTRNIGFEFYFDGVPYTTFSPNANGLITLGRNSWRYSYNYYFPNSLSSSYYPAIMPFWEYLRYGRVSYKLFGSAPNRVLVIDYDNFYGSSSLEDYYFQVRLYEGSNRIEFFYDRVYTYAYGRSATIGIASGRSRWMNVYEGVRTPGGSPTVYDDDDNRYTTSFNPYYGNGRYYNGTSGSSLYRYHIPDNALWTFNPCDDSIRIAGDPDAGGTLAMEEGDDLIGNESTQRGSSESFTPFRMTNPDNGCGVISYSATFSGPAAGDYMMVPGSMDKGETVYPEIVFTPQAIGERTATMTFRMSNGTTTNYLVSADGLTRIDWVADLDEGGIPGMSDGGTIISNIDVPRNDSRDLMPFTLINTNPDAAQFPADITYVLNDPLEQYSLDVPNGTVTETGVQQTGQVSLTLGESSTPVITFSPNMDGSEYGSGAQEATLTVIADGEQRTFPVAGFAVAPALTMELGGTDVKTSDRNFFRGTVSCVGEVATVLELTLTNTNRVDVELEEFGVYAVDSRVQQGTPKYPHELDNFGNLVHSDDYILSMSPGVAPISDNPRVRFPLTIEPGESRTYYLTYVGQRPGKRYARAFLRTNAVNYYAPDMNNFTPGEIPTPDVEGLMTMEFFGHALGSTLASSADGGGADGLSLTFNPVKVGESTEAETTVYNTGECDLRISVDRAHLTTGDVEEFELLDVFGGATMDGQDYVIAPGASATLKARFTPSRSGSRRASVLLQTNDSLVGVAGVTSPGVYYLNLYGVGKADLRAYGVSLDPAVLEGPGSQGVVRLVNTSSEVVEVTGAVLEGANISEITEDPANPWPVLPAQMEPGDELEFGVALNAESGSEPGVRTAEIAFTYSEAESVRAPIEGLVGTRKLTATPGTLFGDVETPVGAISRRTVVLSNQGTFPVTLDGLRIEGPGAAEYEVMSSGRTVIDAGGFEFVEVTYAPTVPGSQGATLVVENNGIDGPISIALSGTSLEIHGGGSATPTGSRVDPDRPAARSEVGTGGLRLTATPNPVRGSTLLRMSFPVEGTAELQIYGLDGRAVATLLSEGVEAGSREIRLDGTGLAAGSYMLRLEQGGSIVTRAITVVK